MSLRLPGSRNDGENPKVYLTEGKMGDRFDSRGGGLLLPSSAREDISTGRSDKTSTSSKNNGNKNRALLRLTNLKFCTKTNLSKQLKMKGGDRVSLKLIGLKRLGASHKGKLSA